MHKLWIEWVGGPLNLTIRPSVLMIVSHCHEDRQAKTHHVRLETPSEETKTLADRVLTIANSMLQLTTVVKNS